MAAVDKAGAAVQVIIDAQTASLRRLVTRPLVDYLQYFESKYDSLRVFDEQH